MGRGRRRTASAANKRCFEEEEKRRVALKVREDQTQIHSVEGSSGEVEGFR